MSWAAWKTGALNRVFLEQGVAGQSARITEETVLHGYQMRRRIEDQGQRDERV